MLVDMGHQGLWASHQSSARLKMKIIINYNNKRIYECLTKHKTKKKKKIKKTAPTTINHVVIRGTDGPFEEDGNGFYGHFAPHNNPFDPSPSQQVKASTFTQLFHCY